MSSENMSEITTVYPLLEGEEGYTVIGFYKKMGIGAFVNGRPVKEKRPEDYLSDENREREFRDFLREEKIRMEWNNYAGTEEEAEEEEE